jgi:hypothetical protein
MKIGVHVGFEISKRDRMVKNLRVIGFGLEM